MKVDLNKPIMTMLGKPVRHKETKDSEEKDFTAKTACVNALMSEDPEEDRKISGDEKVKRFVLANLINESVGEVELKSEDLTLIKRLVNRSFGTLIVARVFDIIEGVKKP